MFKDMKKINLLLAGMMLAATTTATVNTAVRSRTKAKATLRNQLNLRNKQFFKQ